jgi:hypothetical protein
MPALLFVYKECSYVCSFIRIISIALVLACQAVTSFAQEATEGFPTDLSAALARITARDLESHVALLASDLLEGRGTPSRGLDLAAEYIAAQFHRAGLEPVNPAGYFQVANWQIMEPDADAFALELTISGAVHRVSARGVSGFADRALELNHVGLVRIEATAEGAARLTAEEVEGKAVVADLPDPLQVPPTVRAEAARRFAAVFNRLRELKAALLLVPDRETPARGLGEGELIDPEQPDGPRRGGARRATPPRFTVHDPKAAEALAGLKVGETGGSATLRIGEPRARGVELKNVAGILRGSDPELKNSYVLLTAHYDHIGIGSAINGDAINNGANDNGSGTAAVVETALALGSMRERPRRSILFLTFFGEERGLLGSRYYARHPIVPLEKTAAMINLEQVGRTDDSEGARLKAVSVTGLDYSSVGAVLQRAGQRTGIAVERHPRHSDMYFRASDNIALAEQGVPAHTICTSFQFPDYHGRGDHWDKIDYENMALVNRMIAVSAWMLADDPKEPEWNGENPRTRGFIEAWRKRRAGLEASR